MYETYYQLNARPFQLQPDPDFFFSSKGHKRAMSYLEYGLSRGEGFIVITGEVGAGKTTLMRNLFRRLPQRNIVAAQIANTHIDAGDALKMVASAFGLDCNEGGKGDMLIRLEQYLRQSERDGKRALLVVDEAQNLSPDTMEELRMLSNFQSAEQSLLQIFLLGQPEFRLTLQRPDMLQLRQRVIATCHLGPLDGLETREYIEHRLHTAGWNGDPALSTDACYEIFKFSGGIPRKINTLCDRLFLQGYLEQRHLFRESDVREVIADIQFDFAGKPDPATTQRLPANKPPETAYAARNGLAQMDARLHRVERSVIHVIDSIKHNISAQGHVQQSGAQGK